MDKNKSLFYTLMVIFCILIAGIGGFMLGKSVANKEVIEVQNGQ